MKQKPTTYRSLSTRLMGQQTFMKGVTLIELLITVAILAILLGIAAPSFNQTIREHRITFHANNLAYGARLARTEAIKRNTEVIMCTSSDGETCSSTGGWHQGWIIRHPSSNFVIHRQSAAQAGFAITSGFRQINFPATGIGVSTVPATVPMIMMVCRAPSNEGNTVVISPTGRGSIGKTESCSS